MNWSTIKYFLREARISLARNRLLSLATATTVSICIFILGMAILLFMNSGELIEKLESDVEIVAFLDEDLTLRERNQLEERLKKHPGVLSVSFVSRDKALASLEKKLGQGEYDLLATLEGNNPLPDSFRIKGENPRQVEQLAKELAGMQGISKLRYGQEVVRQLFAATRWVRIISVFIVVFLGVAAVFLVATTIRLTIFSRRKEIYIMKLVGATNRFIRAPFFLEGIALAGAGTVFALICLYLGYHYLLENIQPALAFLPLINDDRVLLNLFLGLGGAGIGLGIIGTFISVNRFLNV
ncbi:MAG: permease-like cell division protein FtsX [Syntrophomonadales bacterium]|jgi:cell division transport system permease protein